MTKKDAPNGGKRTTWQKIVPVVKTEKGYQAYITTDIQLPDVYNEVCFKLLQAKKGEEFRLVINTPGGVIDSGFMLVDAIKRSKAKVIADICGTVASAGTIITLACDEVVVADHTSFMIHNYSSGMQGKGHELKAYQNFLDKELNIAFGKIYKGFLTAEEVIDVVDGKDLWLNKTEVLSRWERTKGK